MAPQRREHLTNITCVILKLSPSYSKIKKMRLLPPRETRYYYSRVTKHPAKYKNQKFFPNPDMRTNLYSHISTNAHNPSTLAIWPPLLKIPPSKSQNTPEAPWVPLSAIKQHIRRTVSAIFPISSFYPSPCTPPKPVAIMLAMFSWLLEIPHYTVYWTYPLRAYLMYCSNVYAI